MSSHNATRVIVLGNEKGGTGKSTTAMHLCVALLRAGRTVGVMDLDARQKSLSRYLENRRRWSAAHEIFLPMPVERQVHPGGGEGGSEAETEQSESFAEALAALQALCQIVIIDSPGRDTLLSRKAHSAADVLLTPMNDSFVDFDLLARIDPDNFEIQGPSLYSEMVWQSRKEKAQTEGRSIDWIVMRNRLSPLDARNKRRMADALQALAPRIGFRIAQGFAERVIFRELFPMGLTVLDLTPEGGGVALTMSHIAARQEVRGLVKMLKIPETVPSAKALPEAGDRPA